MQRLVEDVVAQVQPLLLVLVVGELVRARVVAVVAPAVLELAVAHAGHQRPRVVGQQLAVLRGGFVDVDLNGRSFCWLWSRCGRRRRRRWWWMRIAILLVVILRCRDYLPR